LALVEQAVLELRALEGMAVLEPLED